MPEIDFDAQVLTDLGFTLGGNDYSQAVSSVKATPQTTTSTFKGGKRNVNKTGRPSWSLATTIGQDYAAATSLVNYLLAHAGETVLESGQPTPSDPDGTAAFRRRGGDGTPRHRRRPRGACRAHRVRWAEPTRHRGR